MFSRINIIRRWKLLNTLNILGYFGYINTLDSIVR